VGGSPDEYATYCAQLLALLASGASDHDVAAALGELRTGRMGMPPDGEADLHAACRAQDWYQWFMEGDEPPQIDR
jgi:hypothetical protein